MKYYKNYIIRHTINVHMGLWTVQVVLLSHDDVLNVFHSEVVTESIIKQSLQLIHSQFLHVALGKQNTRRGLISRGRTSASMPLSDAHKLQVSNKQQCINIL